jgi:hypothetical protein
MYDMTTPGPVDGPMPSGCVDGPAPPTPVDAPPPPAPADALAPPRSVDGSADNTAEKQRGRPFQPGQSGNPNGRPKGSRNRVTLTIEALIEDRSEEIIKKTIEKAVAGDANMLLALVRTMVPVRRDRPVEFEVPPIHTLADAAAASNAILAACAAGSLTPSEAREVMRLIATHMRTIEVAVLEQRLSDLEKKHERTTTAG